MIRAEQPLPFVAGGYGAIVADPPWDYDGGQASRIRPAYPTMSVREICELPVGPLAARQAHLYLWVTPSFTEVGYRVARSWGFRPVSQIVWVKGREGEDGELEALHIGMGSYVRAAHELVILAERGGLTGRTRDIPSVFVAPRTKHSAKPEELQDLAEQLSPGPRLELFARRPRAGWHTWGNEPLQET